jgi:ABC-type Mn2+/Zn2+ transport system permease subunit
MLHMLKGEIVAIHRQDLQILLASYVVIGAVLVLLHRPFIFVSFDRESASVMGMRVMAWDGWLFGLLGVAIALSVLIVGPMLTFAFLIIPPLAARRFCKRMRSFFLLSSLVGGISGLAGFLLSYGRDWPLGPSAIATASVMLLASVAVRKAAE